MTPVPDPVVPFPQPSTQPSAPPPPQRVMVVDLDMPMGSMVGFMVKWAIASIPALLLLGLAGYAVVAAFSVLLYLL